MKIYEYYQDEKKIYLIAEYLKGPELFDYMQENLDEITESRIAFYMQ